MRHWHWIWCASLAITEAFQPPYTTQRLSMVLSYRNEPPISNFKMTFSSRKNNTLLTTPTIVAGLASFALFPTVILPALPVTAVGIWMQHQFVETSTHRQAHYLHFEHQQTALALFGKRDDENQTPLLQIMGTTLLQSSLEELLFHGGLLATQDDAAMPLTLGIWFLSTFLYANSHSSSSTRGFALQATQAGMLGLLALSTHSLIPSILAGTAIHAHVLGHAWCQVHTQLDFANEHPSESFFCLFDYQHKHSLSLADTQRAVSYAFPNPPSQEIVQTTFETFHKDRINAQEFTQLMTLLRRL